MERRLVDPKRLRPRELAVLRVLELSGYWMTTSQIARDARMSWNTVRDTLQDLAEAGIVKGQHRGNMIIWALA